MKTPEQLAADLEERARQDAVRQRRWRSRRERYRIITILVGAMVPSAILSLFGVLGSSGFAAYFERLPVAVLLTTTVAGAAVAALMFALGWGIIRGMILFAVIFALTVVVFQQNLAVPLAAMPLLVCFYVCAGAVVGYLVVLEDEE